VIRLIGNKFKVDDSPCCPSVPTVAVYEVIAGKFVYKDGDKISGL